MNTQTKDILLLAKKVIEWNRYGKETLLPDINVKLVKSTLYFLTGMHTQHVSSTVFV